MPIIINKGTESDPTQIKDAPSSTPAETGTGPKSPPGNKGWMLTGKAAHDVAEAESVRQSSSGNKLYRHWMKEGTQRTLTFLDGALDNQGRLAITMIYEHRIKINGNWTDVPCLEQNIPQAPGPCPLCESRDRRSFVGFLTIIDHTGYVDKQGNEKKNLKRPFVMKLQTFKILQKMAAKRDGLAGWRVEISRTNEKAANVGDVFDFETRADPDALLKKYGDAAQPLDYQELIDTSVLTRDDLVALGYGTTPVGGETGLSDDDLDEEL